MVSKNRGNNMDYSSDPLVEAGLRYVSCRKSNS